MVKYQYLDSKNYNVSFDCFLVFRILLSFDRGQGKTERKPLEIPRSYTSFTHAQDSQDT